MAKTSTSAKKPAAKAAAKAAPAKVTKTVKATKAAKPAKAEVEKVKPAAKAKVVAKPAAKPAPKPAAKPAAKKVAPKVAAPKTVAPKAEKVAKAAKAAPVAAVAKTPGRPGRKKSEGEVVNYVVQAQKLRTLLDILLESAGENIAETAVLAKLAELKIEAHPRTLAREIDRLGVLGYRIERSLLDSAVYYRMQPDPEVIAAFESLESVRKELKKAGLAVLEKQIALAIKGLKG